MKKLFLAGVALAGMIATACAADLPANVFTKALTSGTSAYNWTGFYVGGFGGYGWSNTPPNGTSGVQSFSGGNVFTTASDSSGSFIGGQAGFNWQFSPNWLIGIEAEAAASDISATTTATGISSFSPLFNFVQSTKTKIQDFESVTARAGWVANNWLFYVKGGYGWMDSKAIASGSSQTQGLQGYVLGGGVEWGFATNWSAKIEYLRYHAENNPSLNSFDLNTIRGGVNYRFDWGAPIAANY